MSATVDDILTDFQKFYSKNLNPAQLKHYQDDLIKLDEDLLCVAASAVKSKEPLNFFPTTHTIRRYYNEVTEDRHNEQKERAPIFADIERNANRTQHGREAIQLMIAFREGKLRPDGKRERRLTRDEYLAGMLAMEKKYPNVGWRKNAEELKAFWDSEAERHKVGAQYLARSALKTE